MVIKVISDYWLDYDNKFLFNSFNISAEVLTIISHKNWQKIVSSIYKAAISIYI